MIDLSNGIDDYRLLLEKIVVVYKLVIDTMLSMILSSHSVIIACNRFTIINKIPQEQKQVPSTVPYAKRLQRSGGLQCPCIYRIASADSQHEIATKDMYRKQ